MTRAEKILKETYPKELNAIKKATDITETKKVMLSCEDLSGNISKNFSDISKAFKSLGIVDRIGKELTFQNDAASVGIKNAIVNNVPAIEILKTVAEMLQDGWKGLSERLTKQILNF